MGYVKFTVAGDKTKNKNDNVFLDSRHRVPSFNRYVETHRNDHTTRINMTSEFYKKNFKFEKSSGIYRTDLKWQDLIDNGFTSVIDHREK